MNHRKETHGGREKDKKGWKREKERERDSHRGGEGETSVRKR